MNSIQPLEILNATLLLKKGAATEEKKVPSFFAPFATGTDREKPTARIRVYNEGNNWFLGKKQIRQQVLSHQNFLFKLKTNNIFQQPTHRY